MSQGLTRELLESLYLRHEHAMYNMVYRWVWNEAEARDIVQDVFVRLWQKRESVLIETVEPYAYRIALNLAASRRRLLRLRQWLPLSTDHENLLVESATELELQLNDEKKCMRRALDKLPQKLKQTLVLCEFSTYSYEEIGSILGIPAGTVGSRRNKALKLLNQTLSNTMISEHS